MVTVNHISCSMKHMAKLWLYRMIGGLAVACGAIGVVLPGIPTVPFLLIALWAFTRSSPRVRKWLLDHPTYGPPLRNWQRHGAISKKGKSAALIGMGLSLVVTGWMTGNLMIVGVQAAVLGLVAVYIVTRPSRVAARQQV